MRCLSSIKFYNKLETWLRSGHRLCRTTATWKAHSTPLRTKRVASWRIRFHQLRQLKDWPSRNGSRFKHFVKSGGIAHKKTTQCSEWLSHTRPICRRTTIDHPCRIDRSLKKSAIFWIRRTTRDLNVWESRLSSRVSWLAWLPSSLCWQDMAAKIAQSSPVIVLWSKTWSWEPEWVSSLRSFTISRCSVWATH